jgi:6,7-dimethyl-8-ribityllumazine synthase
MPHEIIGSVDGSGLRIGIVVARFNAYITERLLAGALSALREAGVRDDDVTVVRVPGAFEVPLCARELAAGGGVDAVVCLGAVIRGETPHFDFVAQAAADGVLETMLALAVPLSFGILTTNTVEQAVERSDEGRGNKGAEAIQTAIEMVRVQQELRRGRQKGS